jgi:hypothetical protein
MSILKYKNMMTKLIISPTILVIILTCSFAMTIQAQCYMDRHNTSWYDGWVSCDKKVSPNPQRGSGHWLMYALGHRYVLGKSYFWNHNVPTSLSDGAKEITIDYSLDGISWNTYGNISLIKGTGQNIYEGEEGPDFQNIEARYVLITVLETHGGNCAGISEVKIDVTLSSAADNLSEYNQCITSDIYPNPFGNYINIELNSVCGQQNHIFITDASGRQVSKDYMIEIGNQRLSIPAIDLVSGVYIVHIYNGTHRIQQRVVKVE